MRLLYVAMTRAKEKLIITGRVKDYESVIANTDRRGLSPLDLRQDVSNHVLGIIQPHRAHRAGSFCLCLELGRNIGDLRLAVYQLTSLLMDNVNDAGECFAGLWNRPASGSQAPWTRNP